MKIKKFSCKLLSDIIISQTAATEGNKSTLDFIPGSNFLGIVASQIYNDLTKSEAHTIFHSGQVSFGDAHPIIDKIRALRIPSAWYMPKLEKNKIWVHHLINNYGEIKHLQPKQCRSGFYAFDVDNHTARPVNITTSFAIKSAYDPHNRCSKDGSMYGYEALDKGLEMVFELIYSKDVSIIKVVEALKGVKRVGASRSAQYGSVEIKEITGSEETLKPSSINPEVAVIYADSRLIFLDEFNIPTFQPKVSDFGLSSGEIDYEKSQIRTFQYAPWNFKRQARDTDRCGIEKGSVIVIKNIAKDNGVNSIPPLVGVYKNEGFGKVIVNPDFLNAKNDSNGESLYEIIPEPLVDNSLDNETQATQLGESDQSLLVFLKAKKAAEDATLLIYRLVNEFVKKNGADFKGSEKFASQWGAIRSIAMTENNRGYLRTKIKDYVSSGITESQWTVNKRNDLLIEFIGNENLSDSNVSDAVVNLASEMGKFCKK